MATTTALHTLNIPPIDKPKRRGYYGYMITKKTAAELKTTNDLLTRDGLKEYPCGHRIALYGSGNRCPLCAPRLYTVYNRDGRRLRVTVPE